MLISKMKRVEEELEEIGRGKKRIGSRGGDDVILEAVGSIKELAKAKKKDPVDELLDRSGTVVSGVQQSLKGTLRQERRCQRQLSFQLRYSDRPSPHCWPPRSLPPQQHPPGRLPRMSTRPPTLALIYK